MDIEAQIYLALAIVASLIAVTLALLLHRTTNELGQALDQRDEHRIRAARYRHALRAARAELLATREQARTEHVRAETYLTELDAITEATRPWPTNKPYLRPGGYVPPFPTNRSN